MLKLKCKASTFKELKQLDYNAYKMYKNVEDDSYEFLYKNVDYLVFGILMSNQGLFVLVSELADTYLVLRPLALFDIIDYNMPDIWESSSGIAFENSNFKVYWFYTFKEFGDDEFFYEKLIEGDEKLEKLLSKLKKEYY
ncbi:hypothetical protein [Myroides sp. DF42-4-2]|uniref:hypothetical protein n=1 Tax=Myroides sp. DF42-4-2 TaxID=2746726 RepID=UPI002575DE7E|nr:hypothetical protein [Myroides sp. DF42-4-2]MDM1408403.1 hypothetical protein [Myroides sp. DF42-4-2]